MLAGEKTAWTSLRDAIPHMEQLQSEQRILHSRIKGCLTPGGRELTVSLGLAG